MGQKIILTEKQEKWLKAHFKHTKNEEVARKLGVSLRTAVRLARELGLEKSRQFMRKCSQNALIKANESNLKHGTYPPKGYRIPKSEFNYFQKGVSPLQRLGPEKEALRREKSRESLAKTRSIERARASFGLPQKTKLKVVRHPRKQISQRSYLKKRGYILDEQQKMAYWTEQTRRATGLESRDAARGRGDDLYYNFAPLPHKEENIINTTNI